MTLTAFGLPPQVTAAFDPNPVVAGSIVTMTIRAGSGTPLGSFRSTLLGASDVVSHTAPLTLTVVTGVIEYYLPLIRQ